MDLVKRTGAAASWSGGRGRVGEDALQRSRGASPVRRGSALPPQRGLSSFKDGDSMTGAAQGPPEGGRRRALAGFVSRVG